jgi:taurine dioxygenase
MAVIGARPLANAGAEVIGLNLEVDIPEDVRADLYGLWLQYGVLVFRDAALTSPQHLKLSRCFGTLKIHPIKVNHVDGQPELITVGGNGDGRGAIYLVDDELRYGYTYWHQDMAYTPSISKGAMLRMIKTPTAGGKTAWVDTIKAYAALPSELKKRIATLEVLQRFKLTPDRAWGQPDITLQMSSEQRNPLAQFVDSTYFPPVIHPLLIMHPEAKRNALLLSPLHFDKVLGLPDAEGSALYEELIAFCLRSEFVYTHDWAQNDLVLWDNRRTMHLALGYPVEGERLAYRATLDGDFRSGRYAQ